MAVPAPSAITADAGAAPPAVGAVPARAARLAMVAAAAAFLIFPGAPTYPPGWLASFALRGVLAGLVAALSAPRGGTIARSVRAAALGAVAGGLPLLALAPTAGSGWALLTGIATAAGTATLFAGGRGRVTRWVAVAGALAVVTACYAWTLGLTPGPYARFLAERRAVYASPVVVHDNAFDGELYLRIAALMEGGTPFYAAFQRAWDEGRTHDRLTSPLNFREPGLFVAWRLLPGTSGDALLGWFMAGGLVAAIAGWFLAARFVADGPALLAPIGLLSYATFFVLSSRSWFAFAEPWAAGAVLVGLALLVHGRWTLAALALVAAVATRELAILFAPAWVVAWWLAGRPRGRFPAVLLATVGVLVPIILHVLTAPAPGQVGLHAAGTWLHSTGLPRLARALRHGMELMPHGAILASILLVAALFGAASLRDRVARGTLATAIAVPAVFLIAISAGPYDYYWGAILMPVVLALAPLAFARGLPSSSPATTAS